MQILCPNCQQRASDTLVDYDEVMRFRYSVRRASGLPTVRSFSSITKYGQARLCAPCAARYRRMVRLRTVGWKIANPGLVALLLSVLLFGCVVGGTPGLRHSPVAYIVGIPVALAVVAVLVGSSLALVARIMRPSAMRFLLAGAPTSATK
jgi:hypothetical protein